MLFRDDRSEHRFLIICSLLAAIFLYFLYQSSAALEGGMDSYQHFLMAKYSWKHPELLLDQWGKPLFTLIYSPFAQFGIGAVVFLNSLCLIGSAWLAYNIALNFGLRYSYLVFMFTLLSPIFTDKIISGLTEPITACLLCASIFFLSKRQYAIGALITGFLPYVRTEGFIFLAVIGFYLLFIEKQYKALLFLLIGSIFFNTMGWIIENEPLWIISSNPYLKIGLTDNPLYGQGEWYHYARWSNVLFGMINSILLLAGIVILIWRYLNDVRNRQLKAFFFLIAGIFCAYFAAHSIIWWKGWMGSAGLVRVMLVVSPLAALLAVQAIEYSSTFLRERWKTVFGFLFMVNAVYAPFKYNSYKYPLELSNEQKLYDQMLSWLQKQEFNTRTWAYMYPYLSLQTNRDPWNRNEHEELWMTSIPYYKEGTILIWDAHFGPNEAGIPLEMLLESENFRLIKSFKPKVQFKVLNNYDFEIYVFEKLSETES